MAKKAKTEESEVKTIDPTLDIVKAFEKEYGKGVFIRADQFLDKPKQVIPFAPKIDTAIKGIPEGSCVICSGHPKTGKTTSTLSFAANCQKPENGGRDVFYFDVEGRLKHMNLNGIKGLNMEKFFVIQSTEEKILSAEDFLNMAVHVLTTRRKALIIIDSASALCATKEQLNSVTGSTRNEGPKLLASFFRKIANIIGVSNNILWIMQHLIADTSGHGAGYKEDGGQKIQYQADVKIRVKWSKPWTVGDKEDGKQIGQKIQWRIITSALGGLPNQDAETCIRYGIGVDYIFEYLDLAKSLGIIEEAGGGWHTIDGQKVQGSEKAYNLLCENPELFESIRKQVDGLLKD